MTQPTPDAVTYAAALLAHYCFDLKGSKADKLVQEWLRSYSDNWVFGAVVEALYQGRYKAVSVEQILAVWQRRGQPIFHFNGDFQRLVCRQLPTHLAEAMGESLLLIDERELPEIELTAAETAEIPKLPPAAAKPENQSKWEASKYPIHQFTPAATESPFYQKIKAIAQSQESPPTDPLPEVTDSQEVQASDV